MKTLAIIGSGDLGQQIAHYAISDNHYGKIVFFDDFATVSEINGYEILGNSDSIEKEYLKRTFDELIIGIGYNHLLVRKTLFERFNGIIPFGKVIHSSSWVDNTAKIENGSVIYPCCSIDANVIIGNNVIINISSVIAHDTKIDSHCFISPRVALAGFIHIKEMCIIGINSTIIDNINITSNTRLGGGTVVIKNIDEPGLYVGNPQRFVR
ncbi:acetyltransferase [Flavobacterium sharifuzzamanii]|uniref:acetyltransferase n=1 Tax=Flavobacterium sharifuzzamanii TaxID=2211133 RepID=UPI000DAD4D41|nr:acetyltransferase [Flavobacterium sharifuzzamanii]KAF2081148.1 acetyltransferase [Flavobacterium sharifuzzamanii]